MRLSELLIASAMLASAGAFAPAAIPKSVLIGTVSSPVVPRNSNHKHSVLSSMTDPNHEEDTKDEIPLDLTKMGTGALAVWAATASSAVAAGPDWGIFEGRIGSLLHPITMGSLLLFSLYTALLGFQWRRQRTIGDEISALKKTLPDLQGASSLAEAIAAAQEAKDFTRVSKLEAAVSIDKEVKDLQNERKELSAKGPRDQHHSQGALLAFVGTAFAIEGPLNTYARAGKLFPGPHLYAGAGLVVLWALAAACVPAMTKGSDTARTVHIGANVAGIGLFAWQVVSGVPILLKVVELTKWP